MQYMQGRVMHCPIIFKQHSGYGNKQQQSLSFSHVPLVYYMYMAPHSPRPSYHSHTVPSTSYDMLFSSHHDLSVTHVPSHLNRFCFTTSDTKSIHILSLSSALYMYKSKYKKVGVLPIRVVQFRNIRLYYLYNIGSTPTFLYFDLYLYSAYAAHYVICLYLHVQYMYMTIIVLHSTIIIYWLLEARDLAPFVLPNNCSLPLERPVLFNRPLW